ncbi:hypothetical protein X975_14422, partial [Stegodyphus mimosarum]
MVAQFILTVGKLTKEIEYKQKDSYMLKLIINTILLILIQEFIHKQLIECGGSAKWRNKRHRGTAKDHLESYLSEFIWQQHQVKENRDCFESMLNSISAHFPPKSD